MQDGIAAQQALGPFPTGTTAPAHSPLSQPLNPQQKSGNGSSSSKPPALSLFSSSSSKPASTSTPKTTTPVSSSPTTLDTAALNGRSSTLSGSGSGLTGSGKPVRVTFTLQQELPFGQSLKLVGSHPALGERWARVGRDEKEVVGAALKSGLGWTHAMAGLQVASPVSRPCPARAFSTAATIPPHRRRVEGGHGPAHDLGRRPQVDYQRVPAHWHGTGVQGETAVEEWTVVWGWWVV